MEFEAEVRNEVPTEVACEQPGSQTRRSKDHRVIELRRLIVQKVAKILNEGGSRRQAGPSCGFQETWRLMRRKTKKEKEEEVTCMKRESKTHGKKTWPRHAATHTLTHTHTGRSTRTGNQIAVATELRTTLENAARQNVFSFFHVSSGAAGAISSARGGTGGCTCASKV